MHAAGGGLDNEMKRHGKLEALQVFTNLHHLFIYNNRDGLGIATQKNIDEPLDHGGTVKAHKRLGKLNTFLYKTTAFAGGNNSVVHKVMWY